MNNPIKSFFVRTVGDKLLRYAQARNARRASFDETGHATTETTDAVDDAALDLAETLIKYVTVDGDDLVEPGDCAFIDSKTLINAMVHAASMEMDPHDLMPGANDKVDEYVRTTVQLADVLLDEVVQMNTILSMWERRVRALIDERMWTTFLYEAIHELAIEQEAMTHVAEGHDFRILSWEGLDDEVVKAAEITVNWASLSLSVQDREGFGRIVTDLLYEYRASDITEVLDVLTTLSRGNTPPMHQGDYDFPITLVTAVLKAHVMELYYSYVESI